jgi:hypothetical protein
MQVARVERKPAHRPTLEECFRPFVGIAPLASQKLEFLGDSSTSHLNAPVARDAALTSVAYTETSNPHSFSNRMHGYVTLTDRDMMIMFVSNCLTICCSLPLSWLLALLRFGVVPLSTCNLLIYIITPDLSARAPIFSSQELDFILLPRNPPII